MALFFVLSLVSACKTTSTLSDTTELENKSTEPHSFKPLFCGANTVEKHDIVAICLGHIAGKYWPGIKTFTAILIETKDSKTIYEIASSELMADDLNITVNYGGDLTYGQIEIKDWQSLTPAHAVFAGAKINSFQSVEENLNQSRWPVEEAPKAIMELLSTYLEAKGLKARGQDIADLEPRAMVTVSYFKIRVLSHFVIRFSGKIGDVGPIIRSTPSRYDFVGETSGGKYYLYEDKEAKGTTKPDFSTTRFKNLTDLNQERFRIFLEFSGFIKRDVDPVRAIDRDDFDLQIFTVDGIQYEYLTAIKSARKIGGVFIKDSTKMVGHLADGKIKFFSNNEFNPKIDR